MRVAVLFVLWLLIPRSTDGKSVQATSQLRPQYWPRSVWRPLPRPGEGKAAIGGVAGAGCPTLWAALSRHLHPTFARGQRSLQGDPDTVCSCLRDQPFGSQGCCAPPQRTTSGPPVPTPPPARPRRCAPPTSSTSWTWTRAR